MADIGPKNYRFDEESGKYKDSAQISMEKIRKGAKPAGPQPYGQGKYFYQPQGPSPYFTGSLTAAGEALEKSPYQQMYKDIYGELGAMQQRPRGGGGVGGMPTIATPEYGEQFKGFQGQTAGYIGGLMEGVQAGTGAFGQVAITARENIMRGAQQYADEEIKRRAQAGGYAGTAREQKELALARQQTEQNVELVRSEMDQKAAQYGLNVGQLATQFHQNFTQAELGMENLKQQRYQFDENKKLEYKRMAQAASMAGINNAFRAISMKLQTVGLMRGEQQDLIDNYYRGAGMSMGAFQFGTTVTVGEQQSQANRQHYIDLAKMAAKSGKKNSIWNILGKGLGIAGTIIGTAIAPGAGTAIGSGIGNLFGAGVGALNP